MIQKTLRSKRLTLVLVFLFCLGTFNPGISKPVAVAGTNKMVIGSDNLIKLSNAFDPALCYNSYSLLFSDRIFENINYLDSNYANGTLALQLMNLVYEGLVTYDGGNIDSFKGVLASSWDVSSNGTVYTFHLKHNVLYHDGTSFNAYTMKYSIDRLIITNHKLGPVQFLDQYISGASNLAQVSSLTLAQANQFLQADGITAPDEFTLQIKLISSYPVFLSLLSYDVVAVSPYSIINHTPSSYNTSQTDSVHGMVSLQTMFPHLTNWTKLGLESNHDPAYSGIIPQGDIVTNTWISTNMVGTGPYILTNNIFYELDFTKNPNWHDSFKVAAPDQISWIETSTIINTGYDFINTFNIENYLSTLVDSSGKSRIAGFTVYNNSALINFRLTFNVNDSLTYLVNAASNISATWNQTHISDAKLVRYSMNDTYLASVDNPFTSLKFREAFSTAFDYDTFLADAFPYIATRSEGVIPLGMDGYQSQLIQDNIQPSFNLTLAKSLFQEVGWRGNITLPHGSGVYGSGIRSTADILLANAINSLNVGIKVIAKSDYSKIQFNYTSLVFDKENWGGVVNDPYGAVFDQLDSQGISSQIFSHYSNPTIDQLISQSKTETNFSNRMNLFKQIEVDSAMDFPAINLMNMLNLYVVNNSLTDILPSSSFNPLIPGFNFQFSNGPIIPISTSSPISTTISITASTSSSPSSSTSLSSSTTSTSSSSSNTNSPGFEFVSVGVLAILFLKRKTKNN